MTDKKDNITSIAPITDEQMTKRAIQTLEDAIVELSKPDFKGYNKILIIALNDANGNYNISRMKSGLKDSECISLIDCCKTNIKNKMGIS